MVDVIEALFVQEAGDWRQPYLDYLQHKLFPPNRTDAAKIRKKSSKFFVEEGELFRRGFGQSSLRCIASEQTTTILREVHSGECGEHQGGFRLAKQVMHVGYYWPTMEADLLSFARRCQSCQLYGNIIHAPVVELHILATPWPFCTCAIDFVGTISPCS